MNTKCFKNVSRILTKKQLLTDNQGMRQHGCSGCTNPQIFGASHFTPVDFEAFSTNVQPLLFQNRLHPQIQIPCLGVHSPCFGFSLNFRSRRYFLNFFSYTRWNILQFSVEIQDIRKMTEIVSSNVSVDSYTIFLKYKDKAKKIKFSASLTLFFCLPELFGYFKSNY